jgi:hypothetical protein
VVNSRQPRRIFTMTTAFNWATGIVPCTRRPRPSPALLTQDTQQLRSDNCAYVGCSASTGLPMASETRFRRPAQRKLDMSEHLPSTHC